MTSNSLEIHLSHPKVFPGSQKTNECLLNSQQIRPGSHWANLSQIPQTGGEFIANENQIRLYGEPTFKFALDLANMVT